MSGTGTALVIGGTGPTGPHIVEGLLTRGFRVSVLHSGRHEIDELPPSNVVPHIHADAFDEASLREALGTRTFDLVISTYGRLRVVADVLKGRTGRLISVGGGTVYAGFMDSHLTFPAGTRVPTRESAPLVDEHHSAKLQRIRLSEEAVFRNHETATHLRFPYVFGPRAPLPREWPIVKRALDRRRELILVDSGLTVSTSGYAPNVAHAILLAVDREDVAAGKTYNVGDDRWFTLAQVAEIIADELDHSFEIIGMPFREARPAYSTVAPAHSSHHRIVDCSLIRHELDYRDVHDPEEGLRRTVRWQAEVLSKDHAEVDRLMQDPYDYAAEDQLIAAYREFAHQAKAIRFKFEPGYSSGYYGSVENPGPPRLSFRVGAGQQT